ncbi:MAG: RloB family protein [Campylobacterota bacterium]|nr:RloB family protein [Campylobacterota bacterium]
MRRNREKPSSRKKEQEKKDFQRRTNDKEKVHDIIISCEDSVSAPAYFQKIIDKLIEAKKITQDSIVIVNQKKIKGTNPTKVLERLKNYNEDGKSYKDFADKWIVIDRDTPRVNNGGHTAKDFNEAIQNSKSKISKYNVEVAYANDSFELWYLLHFDYIDSSIHRDDINKKLIQKLKVKNSSIFSNLNSENIKTENYTKLIFDELLSSQDRAVKNAEKLLIFHGSNHNPEKDNPSTTVHKLVEILNSL